MSSYHEDSDNMSANEESEDYEVTLDDLIRAAQHGLLEDVGALVTYHGLDLNGLDSESKWTALQVASFNGHIDVVRFLLESGADVNKRWEGLGFQQWSAIHFAANRGHRGIVELLLSHGARVNDVECEGKSAIHLACASGNEELVKFLLANGATIHDRDQHGYNPLICACFNGHHEVVLTLLAYGAKVDYRADNDVTPLFAACSAGDNDIVMTLLANGGDINDYDFPHVSPLYSASQRGRDEVVMTLLARGAQLRGRDFSNWNPLHSACAGGHYKVVEILLSQGAAVKTRDQKGLAPLQNVFYGIFPSQFVPHLQMTNKAYTLKILLESGMDPGVLDKEGLTTFERVRKDEWPMFAFIKDQHRLALLLDYGVGTGVVCRPGKCGCNTTALMCWYLFFRMLFTVSLQAPVTTEPLIDAFEKYFIKNSIVGLYPCNEEKAFEPPEYGLDWNQSRRAAYKAECEAELSKMKTDTIGNTCATYFSLLTRDVSALRHRNLLGQLSGDQCVQRYTIYGSMIFSSYTRLRRLFLEEVGPGFFAILSPPLLPECAEVVQRYLSVKDLENIVEVYHAYQLYLEKLSKLVASPNE